MILKEITNKILENICSAKALGKDFNISCEFVSKEFNQIDLESVNREKQSYTVLVLPHLPKTQGWKNEFSCWVNLKTFLKNEKLFGNNLKGGESSG